VSSRQANYLAEEAGLDLVEIAPQAAPPVCRIMDYGKFKYQEAKKAHEAKQKQKQVQVKEIKLRPGTDENDYQIKLRNMIRFLEEEDKVKVTLRFRGREMAHQEFGMRQLERIRNDLDAYGLVEQMPKMEGRQMVMIIGPAKKKLEKPEKPVEKSTDKPARLGTAKLATPAAAKPAAAKPAEVVEKSAEEAEA
jgi:translation initiation factor IF-3